jgi:hypothetical protein
LTNSRGDPCQRAQPSDLADRIRRDIGRSVLRAKNGIKFMTGIVAPMSARRRRTRSGLATNCSCGATRASSVGIAHRCYSS